jgi:hypothetical protein
MQGVKNVTFIPMRVSTPRAPCRPNDYILYGGPSYFGSSVWNLLNVTLVMPRILRWFLDFWKVYAPLLSLSSPQPVVTLYESFRFRDLITITDGHSDIKSIICEKCKVRRLNRK